MARKSDGNADFSGGMDSYKSPSLLSNNQYYLAVNCQIKPGINGISTRPGYREVKLSFEDKREIEFFRYGNIQGCGYYYYEGDVYQIVSCAGRIYELREIDRLNYSVRFVNRTNNPNNPNCWITKVPKGAIINDGESSPIAARERNYSRVSGKKSIGAGKAGAYIQNRFFYISGDGLSVRFSTINNSISIEEPINNNISGGFLTPDDTEIKAIGMQRFVRKDTNGGSLLFSTRDNIYSVNVSGPITQWGKVDDYGIISGTVFDIGACSPYSFLPLNSNVYFRNKNLGIASLQYLQYIWDNTDIIEPQSYGGHLFFNNDDDYLLDSCYSVAYRNSIYTTVSPSLYQGSVYWNGLVTTKPEQKGIISYHSLYTGIRPWCLHTVKDTSGIESLYIFSHDHDGVNRMYILDESLDYDIKASGDRVEIESKLCTRFFQYEDGFAFKRPVFNKMVMSQKSPCLKMTISTRHSSDDNFTKIYALDATKDNCAGLSFVNSVPERSAFPIIYPDRYGEQKKFVDHQDLIEITGSFNLHKLIKITDSIPDETAITDKKVDRFVKFNRLKLFDYKIYGR